jgi:hypothetical protein
MLNLVFLAVDSEWRSSLSSFNEPIAKKAAALVPKGQEFLSACLLKYEEKKNSPLFVGAKTSNCSSSPFHAGTVDP